LFSPCGPSKKSQCCFKFPAHDWMTHRPQVGRPCSPWQASLGPPQRGPVSPGPLELWLLAMASAAAATCWAHQSAFVSLVSHCVTHTKGPAPRGPTAPLCPELAFPKLPNPPPLSLSPATPPPPQDLNPPLPPGIHQHLKVPGWWRSLPFSQLLHSSYPKVRCPSVRPSISIHLTQK